MLRAHKVHKCSLHALGLQIHNHGLFFPQDLHLIQGMGGIKKGQNSKHKDHHEFSTSVLIWKQECFLSSLFLYDYTLLSKGTCFLRYVQTYEAMPVISVKGRNWRSEIRVQQEEPRRGWIQVNKDQQQFSPVLLLDPALLQFYNFTIYPQCTQDVSSWVSGPGSQAQQAPCAHLLCQGARAARAVCAQTCCTWCSGRIPWASNSIPSGDFQEQTRAQQVQKRNPKGFQNVKGKKEL